MTYRVIGDIIIQDSKNYWIKKRYLNPVLNQYEYVLQQIMGGGNRVLIEKRGILRSAETLLKAIYTE